MSFSNVYDDTRRAQSYARLEFPGTYYLAFRDLPAIFARHVSGRNALDFGCGAGRSTRFLESLGFDATGIDVSPSMIEMARRTDPAGKYQLVPDGDFGALPAASFDLIFCAFPFDNIPGVAKREALLSGLRDLLAPSGRIVLLGSTPEIYWHEWASFTTRDFRENRHARSGDEVRIIMKDVDDRRPVIDLIWFPGDYAALFAAAGLNVLAHELPLGRVDEGIEWVSETSVPPWIMYVLAR